MTCDNLHGFSQKICIRVVIRKIFQSVPAQFETPIDIWNLTFSGHKSVF